MHPIEGHPIDFLAQLDKALQQHPKPKSRLASYFESHLLFQGAYRTPSPSPSPSPPPAPSLASATPTSKKRKRAASSSEPDATLRSSKRQRRVEPESTAAPPQPVPAATTSTSVATKLAETTAIAPKPAATCTTSHQILRTRKTPGVPVDTYLRVRSTPASVLVGKYSLRRTAARIQAYKSA